MIYEDDTNCCPRPIGFSCEVDCSDWPRGERNPSLARSTYVSATMAAPLIKPPCVPESCDPVDFQSQGSDPLCCSDNQCIPEGGDDGDFLGIAGLGVAAMLLWLSCGGKLDLCEFLNTVTLGIFPDNDTEPVELKSPPVGPVCDKDDIEHCKSAKQVIYPEDPEPEPDPEPGP